jgi:hypothetical protein
MNSDGNSREKVVTRLFKESVPLNSDKSLIFEILEYPDSGRVAIIRKHDRTKSDRHALNMGRLYLSYQSLLILKQLLNNIDMNVFESIMRKTKDLSTSELLSMLDVSLISFDGDIEDVC